MSTKRAETSSKISSGFSSALSKALLSSFESNPKDSTPKHFSINTFLIEWFRKRGTPLYFLFKQNLKITNLQIAELLSLLRLNVIYKWKDGQNIRGDELQFLSVAEFKTAVDSLVKEFTREQPNVRTVVRNLESLYAPLLQRIIVVDCFFGSCGVLLPPGLDLKLAEICASAGYIHSCGDNILSVNIERDDAKELLFQRLEHQLIKHKPKPPVPRFLVFGHEDFSIHERPHYPFLRDGLNEVKLFIDKYYLGRDRLVTVLKQLSARFEGRLHIPEPNHVSQPDKDRDFKKGSRTLFLLTDYGLTPHPRQRSDRQYLICYEQLYKNQNPHQFFEENKPGWVDHTTIPHTLVGAMINITKPWWPEGRPAVVGDLFVGTGTTALEAASHNVEFVGVDDLELAETIVRDNFDFFRMSANQLQDWSDAVQNILKRVPESLKQPRSKVGRVTDSTIQPYFDARNLLATVLPDPLGPWHPLSGKQLKAFQSARPFLRLLFYIALRADRRHIAALQREKEEWWEAFCKEASDLDTQIRDLSMFRSLDVIKKVGNVSIVQGRYSESCFLDPLTSSHERPDARTRIFTGRAEYTSLNDQLCDVIITDPPYGFNTTGDAHRTADLYARVIPRMIGLLRPKGQLIFSLPDSSHTGRAIPIVAMKELVTKQVLFAAAKLDREVIVPAISTPELGRLFQAPFYWESEKALRRVILHFHIRKTNTS